MQKLKIFDQNFEDEKVPKKDIETLAANSRKYHLVSPMSDILLTQ